jgi:hypothetical protein
MFKFMLKVMQFITLAAMSFALWYWVDVPSGLIFIAWCAFLGWRDFRPWMAHHLFQYEKRNEALQAENDRLREENTRLNEIVKTSEAALLQQFVNVLGEGHTLVAELKGKIDRLQPTNSSETNEPTKLTVVK